jgi:hypothetical protein
VRRLLQRRPEDRPSAHSLLTDRIFQARNTTTQVRAPGNDSMLRNKHYLFHSYKTCCWQPAHPCRRKQFQFHSQSLQACIACVVRWSAALF